MALFRTMFRSTRRPLRRTSQPWLLSFALVSLFVAVALAIFLPLAYHAAGPSSEAMSQLGEKTPAQQGKAPTVAYRAPHPQDLYVLDLNVSVSSGVATFPYVRVLDRTTRQEILTISVRQHPNIALSPNGRYLYVLDSFSTRMTRGTGVMALTIHDLQRGRLVADIDLPAMRTPYIGIPSQTEILSSADDTKLYILLLDVATGLRVVTVDLRTLKVVQNMPTDAFCGDVQLSGVADQLVGVCGGTLTTIDLGKQRLSTFALQGTDTQASIGPLSIQAHGQRRGRSYLYAVSDTANGSMLTTIDLVARTRSAAVRIDLPTGATMIDKQLFAVSPDGDQVYVGLRGSSSVRHGLNDQIIFGQGTYVHQIGIFDVATGNRTALIQLPTSVATFTLSQDGKTLYGASPHTQSISFIDVATGKVTTRSDVGQAPALIITTR